MSFVSAAKESRSKFHMKKHTKRKKSDKYVLHTSKPLQTVLKRLVKDRTLKLLTISVFLTDIHIAYVKVCPYLSHTYV